MTWGLDSQIKSELLHLRSLRFRNSIVSDGIDFVSDGSGLSPELRRVPLHEAFQILIEMDGCTFFERVLGPIVRV